MLQLTLTNIFCKTGEPLTKLAKKLLRSFLRVGYLKIKVKGTPVLGHIHKTSNKPLKSNILDEVPYWYSEEIFLQLNLFS